MVRMWHSEVEEGVLGDSWQLVTQSHGIVQTKQSSNPGASKAPAADGAPAAQPCRALAEKRAGTKLL